MISLAVFDDCLEIWNNGFLPKEIKIADLKRRHESLPRNKLIAKVFYFRGLIETWGTGTNKMADLCVKNGLPEPQFEEYSGGLSVTLKFKAPMGLGVNEMPKQALLSKRQAEIVTILQHEKMLRANDIFSKMSTPQSLRTLKRDLLELRKLGVIDIEGKGPGAVWKLKS